MEVGDWITLAAVLVALGLGVSSLIQTQKLKERERKERLLNEIIEWALDVAKCGSTVNIQSPQPFFTVLVEKNFPKLSREEQEILLKGLNKDNERVWQSRHMELIFRYQTVDARGEYICEISNLPYFNIYASVKEVKDNLRTTLEIYWEYLDDITDEALMEKVTEWEHKLQESAVSLIKEATKIKTKDLI